MKHGLAALERLKNFNIINWGERLKYCNALLLAGFFQGVGGGFIFVPLSVLMFSTLPRHLRNEGASMNALMRNIGNAVGISYLQRELVHFSAASRSHLAEGVRPDSAALQIAQPDFDFASLDTLVRMNQEIVRQASMVGYVQLYWLVFSISVLMLPLILFMRNTRQRASDAPLPAME